MLLMCNSLMISDIELLSICVLAICIRNDFLLLSSPPLGLYLCKHWELINTSCLIFFILSTVLQEKHSWSCYFLLINEDVKAQSICMIYSCQRHSRGRSSALFPLSGAPLCKPCDIRLALTAVAMH